MEAILSNTCEYNEAHLTEALRVQSKEVQGRKNLFLYLAIGLLLAYSLYGWLGLGDGQYLIFCLLCLLMVGILAYLNLGLPRRTAKLQVLRIREKNGGLVFQSQFRPEGVAMLSPSGAENSLLPYSAFSKLVRTEHLLLLFTQDKQMILMDPARFDGGSEEDLFRLLEEKCPGVLPRVKQG